MTPARTVMFALALALTVAATAVSGCGEGASGSASQGEAYRIGITQFATHPALDAAVRGFREGLAEKGIRGVVYDAQNADGDIATAVSIAQKFGYEDLDLVFAVATPATQAVTRTVKTTPVVFAAVTDPLGAGIVSDLVAPTGNVTGVSNAQPVKPILQLVERLKPGARRIGLVYNPGEANSDFTARRVDAAAAQLGLTVVKAPVSTSAEVQAAAQSLVGRVDFIAVISDNTAVSALEAVVKVCEENAIPLLAGDTDSVRRGAAIGYAFDYEDLGRRAGHQAAAILTGTPVKEIPVEFSRDLKLSVNQRAAEKQGLIIPADVLAEATIRL